MGSGLFDDKQFTLQCPGCGADLYESIGRLKTNPQLLCSGCGKTIQIEADDLRRGLDSAEKTLDEFHRSVSKMFK